eukprot:3196023-Pyramimonas_sp.AAC.1
MCEVLASDSHGGRVSGQTGIFSFPAPIGSRPRYILPSLLRLVPASHCRTVSGASQYRGDS